MHTTNDDHSGSTRDEVQAVFYDTRDRKITTQWRKRSILLRKTRLNGNTMASPKVFRFQAELRLFTALKTLCNRRRNTKDLEKRG